MKQDEKCVVNHQIFFGRDELGVVKTNLDGSVMVTGHHLTVNIDIRYDDKFAQEITGLFPLLLKLKQHIEGEGPPPRKNTSPSDATKIPRGSRGEHFSAGENH